jgi:hypothetical protein
MMAEFTYGVSRTNLLFLFKLKNGFLRRCRFPAVSLNIVNSTDFDCIYDSDSLF